jgi:Icc-related predicted phosphoesterase
MNLIKHGRNVHELQLDGKQVHVAMLSDLHWDNPKCDRQLLKKNLDFCKENNIPVIINGDFFCLMQGRGDNRRNKSDIRQEHNNARYLDSIVETASEWFKPYADIIKVIGYGNHETGVIKYQETDLLQRFVDLLNYKCGSSVQTGGYGGWVIIRQLFHGNAQITTKVKYYHGSGGGGVVTKGALNLTRALEMYEDFDVFTMGHIHENSSRNDVRETIKHNAKTGYSIKQKQLHLMLTGTYKEEYGEGAYGWHVERGAPPKPLGGRILKIECKEVDKLIVKNIDSFKFPL